MKKLTRSSRTTLTVLAATAVLLVACTGGAVAGGLVTSAKIKNNTIQSVDVHDGTLTGTDVKDSSLTGSDVRDGSLSGADIRDGSLSHGDLGIYWAEVSGNAALDASTGGVHVQKISTGNYGVDFGHPVNGCAFSATIGNAGGGSSQPGMISVADRDGNVNAVYVGTKDATGTAADRPFHLIVVC